MGSHQKIVISASRRTDIPAFYMPWLMSEVNRGRFEMVNPYNRRVSIVPVAPETVHTIVFWSKNFGPFIANRYGERLTDLGFNLFFNFTINSRHPLLEPNLPKLTERLKQMEFLAGHYHPMSINWRFDPVCFFKTSHEGVQNNLGDFQCIAEAVACFGVKRCITSFMDDYLKIRKRTAGMPDFSFFDPPLSEKIACLLRMKAVLDNLGLSLHTCCEKELLTNLPPNTGITKSACIPNDLLVELFGGNLSFAPDTGQRIKNGCGCMVSVDIGSYHRQPCYHNCLFCYANPSPQSPSETQQEKGVA